VSHSLAFADNEATFTPQLNVAQIQLFSLIERHCEHQKCKKKKKLQSDFSVNSQVGVLMIFVNLMAFIIIAHLA